MENFFRLADNKDLLSHRCIWVNGPVIIGAGPSGLTTAACLREQGVPFVVLEGADCIASLWQKRTYNRLKLHLPKQFCQLPNLPFPDDFPKYPSKKQFINYLETYANKFKINPKFNECVQSAKYDETSGLWRVKTNEVEYICRWLVVATGENAECVTPEISNHIALLSMVVRNSFAMYEEEDHEVNEEDIETQISYEVEETIPKVRSKRTSLRPKWLNDYETPKKRHIKSSHRFKF